jgi:hypothetical protein
LDGIVNVLVGIRTEICRRDTQGEDPASEADMPGGSGFHQLSPTPTYQTVRYFELKK